MAQARVVITIERENEFTNDEVREIMKDIQARLQGYYTKCPECLKNADMKIGYEKVN
jgi:hypothetical protein